MIDFDSIDLDTPAPVKATARVVETAPVIAETVRVAPASQSVGYTLKDASAWGWTDLRDYVIREIEQRHGPQVRNPTREASIFKSFMSRWPEQSVAIAQAAFGPVHDGMWRNAPISVNRFCKASDPFFSAVIAERL